MANPQFVNPKGSNLTPESMFEQKVKAGRNGIQQEFQSEWDSINQMAKINRYSPQRHQQLLTEAQTKAQGRMDKFDQESQATTNNFNNLAQLESQGVITNATEAKWRMVLGSEAERMMPKSGKQADPMKQYSDLDIYRNKLESNVGLFRVQPAGEVPSRLRASRKQSKLIGISPVLTAAWAAWPKEKIASPVVEVFDRSIVAYDAKGNIKESKAQGGWREAKPEEVQEYGLLHEELKRVTEEQNILLRPQTSSLMNTAVKSPRIGGSIKEQTKLLLNQREGNAQQGGDIINRGGKQWRIVGHDTDGTPLVEEVR